MNENLVIKMTVINNSKYIASFDPLKLPLSIIFRIAHFSLFIFSSFLLFIIFRGAFNLTTLLLIYYFFSYFFFMKRFIYFFSTFSVFPRKKKVFQKLSFSLFSFTISIYTYPTISSTFLD